MSALTAPSIPDLAAALAGPPKGFLNLRPAVSEVAPKRRSQEIDERAGEDREVYDPRNHVGDPTALMFFLRIALMRRGGLPGGGRLRMRRQQERPPEQHDRHDDARGLELVPRFTS